MKAQVNFTAFVQAFQDMDRYDQFGYEALKELFDHIEHFEQDTGEEFTLDVIALCCEWSVMPFAEIVSQYGGNLELPNVDEMESEEIARELSAQLETYCYELKDGQFLICDAMI